MSWTIGRIKKLTDEFQRYSHGREEIIAPLKKALANGDIETWLAVARGLYFDYPGITRDVFGFGKTIRYHLNGRLAAEYSRNSSGQRHGEYRGYYIDGRPFEICSFKNGYLHGGCWVYDREGTLALNTYYKDGVEQEAPE